MAVAAENFIESSGVDIWQIMEDSSEFSRELFSEKLRKSLEAAVEDV
jgi:hypothetical protein